MHIYLCAIPCLAMQVSMRGIVSLFCTPPASLQIRVEEEGEMWVMLGGGGLSPEQPPLAPHLRQVLKRAKLSLGRGNPPKGGRIWNINRWQMLYHLQYLWFITAAAVHVHQKLNFVNLSEGTSIQNKIYIFKPQYIENIGTNFPVLFFRLGTFDPWRQKLISRFPWFCCQLATGSLVWCRTAWQDK